MILEHLEDLVMTGRCLSSVAEDVVVNYNTVIVTDNLLGREILL